MFNVIVRLNFFEYINVSTVTEACHLFVLRFTFY